jgi:hypothetical protein
MPIKSNSSSNAHHLKSQSSDMNSLSRTREARRTGDVSIGADISLAHKIQITRYVVCLLTQTD